MKQLNSWLEIDEHEYLMYLLKGYTIDSHQELIIWRLDGRWHREDGPAIIYKDGCQAWYLNGKKHREDGPAVVFGDGSMEWWINSKLHRTDGPAVMLSNYEKQWWLNGQRVKPHYW